MFNRFTVCAECGRALHDVFLFSLLGKLDSCKDVEVENKKQDKRNKLYLL